jgi:hypothetical protein
LAAREEWSLEILSVKNEEMVSGSDVLDNLDGNTVGGFAVKDYL